jgi:hypothetical protein
MNSKPRTWKVGHFDPTSVEVTMTLELPFSSIPWTNPYKTGRRFQSARDSTGTRNWNFHRVAGPCLEQLIAAYESCDWRVRLIGEDPDIAVQGVRRLGCTASVRDSTKRIGTVSANCSRTSTLSFECSMGTMARTSRGSFRRGVSHAPAEVRIAKR